MNLKLFFINLWKLLSTYFTEKNNAKQQQVLEKAQVPDNPQPINTLTFPYNSSFTYVDNEIQVLIEKTVTEVIGHTHSTFFVAPSLCEVTYDAPMNLFSFELILNRNVDYYDEQLGKKDVERFNHHYEHIQVQHRNDCNSLCMQHSDLYRRYESELQNCGYSNINPILVEQAWINYCEALKSLQYFVTFNVEFVSCSKATYDPTGRICVVRFKIY